jgi:hypothetical protein
MSLKPNSDKSLVNVLDTGFDNFSAVSNWIKIGQIQSFDPATQTAAVEILHKGVYEYNLTERELEDYPVLEMVPVVVLGGGSSYVSFPIQKGDYCLILFNDFELDGWWATGEKRPSEYPTRRHDLSDAIAIVGLHCMTSFIQGYSQYLHLHYSPSSDIIIGNQIDINNSSINLNGDTTINGETEVNGTTKINDTLTVTGDITGQQMITGTLHSTHGASGVFTNAAGQKLTIVDGIVVQIG